MPADFGGGLAPCKDPAVGKEVPMTWEVIEVAGPGPEAVGA